MTAALTADTSVTVAALTSSLPAHAITYAALEGRELRLVDHVLLETYSVLTRLPAIRLPQELAAELLRRRFPAPVLSLPTDQRARLVDRMAMAGVARGAVYDGLIAASAAHHEALILSLDRRATRTYEALGARFRLL
jgi:predicted nucleic acid-binding protein